MKYMGSKRSMLTNGLGEVLCHAVPKYDRFVDLFTGSGAVSWHVAQKFPKEVLACDLQAYAVVLSQSIVGRTGNLAEFWIDAWLGRAEASLNRNAQYEGALHLQGLLNDKPIQKVADDSREFCLHASGVMTRAYGGYYFSPLQALQLDALRTSLPAEKSRRAVALAALVMAASKSAAAPGHTAQPFKANESAGKYLKEAWLRDVMRYVHEGARTLCSMHARVAGEAKKANAHDLAATLSEADLTFVDPPYSGVHYSRFYHVLETLAAYEPITVSGEGRYPPADLRPKSKYSLQTESEAAFIDLFRILSSRGCGAIVTFPADKSSNGMSGERVKELADQYFNIQVSKVAGRFSTMGGNLKNRAARQAAEELILVLSSK